MMVALLLYWSGVPADHVYKNNTVLPAGLSNARSVPGSRLIVAAGGTHHHAAIGPVVLVDTDQSRRTTEAMTCITPEIGYHYFFGGADTPITENNSSGWDLNLLGYFRIGLGF